MSDPTGSTSGDRDLRRWLGFWSLMSVPGAAVAMAIWGVPTVLLCSLLPAMLGGAAQAALLTTRGPVVPRDVNLACCRTALATALVAVSVCAVGSFSVPMAMALVAVVVLTSPVVRTRLHEAVGAVPRPAHVSRERVHPVPPALLSLLAKPAQAMTNKELCRAWRRSFQALQQTGTVAQKAVLVQLRQCYLDEIEKRDSMALRAWLESGARAAGGPDRFLDAGGSHREGPDAA